MYKRRKTAIVVFIILGLCMLNVARADDSRSDIIIVLDPGHGGRESGAVNQSLGLVQKDINLKIANAIERELKQYEGVQVYFTHRGLPAEEALSLQARADIAKSYNADLLVCLHINASGGEGAEVFVTYKERFYAESKRFGDIVLQELGKLGIENREVKTRLIDDGRIYPDGTTADYYGIIRNAYLNDIAAVLIEHCFLDSADTRFLDSEEKIAALGRADAAAIAAHYGLRKQGEVRPAFTDTANHWAQDTIRRWADAGYISGYLGKFRPDEGITRAEFLSVLDTVCHFPKAEGNPFLDVKETDWYRDAVLSAYHLNIVAGYADRFYPNDKLTREQACVILARLFNYVPVNNAALDQFSDRNNISDWARDGVAAMVGRGFLIGTEQNTLQPSGNLARGEAIVLLDRILSP